MSKARRVLVTGAASGIGAQAASTLAEREWEVVRSDRRPGDGVIELDVSDADGWSAVVAGNGPFDGLVNAAGIRERAKLLDLTPEQWDRTVAVNLTGAFLGTQAVSRAMVEAGRPGSIVHVASVNSETPVSGQPHYCASKAGVAMLTRAAALELARHGIRVNAVAPGAIRTPMIQDRIDEGQEDALVKRIPRRRLGEPVDIAEGISYLMSDAADYVTGVLLPIDGGFLLN